MFMWHQWKEMKLRLKEITQHLFIKSIQTTTIRKIYDIMLKTWKEFVPWKAISLLSQEEREMLEDQVDKRGF